MVILMVPDASPRTDVLLLHAPYPGALKFPGVPSSLLHAAAPLAHRLAEQGALERLGLLDPEAADASYRARLRALLAGGGVRVLCVSTSTAAIEEAAWAVRLARELRGEEILVLVGGPHEDDVRPKTALAMAGVDLSMAGEVEELLARILDDYLASGIRPEKFVRRAREGKLELLARGLRGGTVTIASRWWDSELALELANFSSEDLASPAWTAKRVRFTVFEAPETLPVMLSRGCSYGRCTFCAEPNRRGVLVRRSFGWLRELCALRPEAAIYFQDSIFPRGDFIEGNLLPLLSSLEREWGCQLFLPTTTKPFLASLAAHGCRYVYTGLESASSDILAGIGKTGLNQSLALDRLRWAGDLGLRVGISLMFGAMARGGTLLENEATVDATVRFAEAIVEAGVPVAGFYPNVMTVLPGTSLARGLSEAGIDLDFYRQPRSDALAGFEDGGVGYNFTTIPGIAAPAERLARRIVEAARHVQSLGQHDW